MITGKDCRQEIEKARRIVKTEEGKALLKIGEINNKVLLNIRLLLDKIREALKVDKIVTKIERPKEVSSGTYNLPRLDVTATNNPGSADIVNKEE